MKAKQDNFSRSTCMSTSDTGASEVEKFYRRQDDTRKRKIYFVSFVKEPFLCTKEIPSRIEYVQKVPEKTSYTFRAKVRR